MPTGYDCFLPPRRPVLRLALQAYPRGEHFQVPNLPNVTAVNALGDFGIAADRLAFIDGEGNALVFSR